jgi:hypothetical protein
LPWGGVDEDRLLSGGQGPHAFTEARGDRLRSARAAPQVLT